MTITISTDIFYLNKNDAARSHTSSSYNAREHIVIAHVQKWVAQIVKGICLQLYFCGYLLSMHLTRETSSQMDIGQNETWKYIYVSWFIYCSYTIDQKFTYWVNSRIELQSSTRYFVGRVIRVDDACFQRKIFRFRAEVQSRFRFRYSNVKINSVKFDSFRYGLFQYNSWMTFDMALAIFRIKQIPTNINRTKRTTICKWILTFLSVCSSVQWLRKWYECSVTAKCKCDIVGNI